jgi:hypothetical protein
MHLDHGVRHRRVAPQEVGDFLGVALFQALDERDVVDRFQAVEELAQRRAQRLVGRAV